MLVIVALSYWLYRSLTGPYEEIRRQKQITEDTRTQMQRIRTALIRYEAVNGRFTADLDSLVMFIQSDSLYQVAGDSLLGPDFDLSSLAMSPRTGNRFILSVNDTSRVQTYLLRDPDTNDRIGTELPDVTLLNASSWE
jgi:hypothetical protein